VHGAHKAADPRRVVRHLPGDIGLDQDAQPYVGLPDLNQASLDVSDAIRNLADFIKARAVMAHVAGFLIVIHQNGGGAIDGSIEGLEKAQQILPSPGLHDVVLHASSVDPQGMTAASQLGDTVSFLIADFYYYGLPSCDRIIGGLRGRPIRQARRLRRRGST